MSLRARLTALLLDMTAPTPRRDPRMPVVRTTVVGPILTPAREAELHAAGQAFVDRLIAKTKADQRCG